MRVKIEFHCDNAAFEDENLVPEVKRVLESCKRRFSELDPLGDGLSLFDSNGNKIGEMRTEML